MAEVVQTGMDTAAMKPLLMRSKKEPVNCALALGQGKGGGVALLLLHKIKQPRALLKELQGQFPDATNARFGTASVDVDVDPRLVSVRINRAVPGMARRLTKTLKGTGITKVLLLLEDGTQIDAHAEEDDETEAGDENAPTVASQDAAAAVPPLAPGQPPGQMAAAAPDPGALSDALMDLIRRIPQTDPAAQAGLKELATQARSSLKMADAASASASIERLRAALAGAAVEGDRAGSDSALGQKASIFAKSRIAWIATRKKVETDVDAVHAAFMTAFKGHAAADDLSVAFRKRVESVMAALDEALAHKLDEVTRTTDPARHAATVAEARALIESYETFIATDPTIKAIDQNPFVPVSIQKTVTATLAALSKAIS